MIKYCLGLVGATAAAAVSAAVTTTVITDVSAGGTVSATLAAARVAFEKSLDPETVIREPFSDFATGPVTTPLTGLFGTGGSSLTVNTGTAFIEGPDPLSGRFDTTCESPGAPPACTPRWFESSGGFSLAFGGSYNAFAFYGTDWGDFSGTLTLTLLDGTESGPFEVAFGGETADGALAFIGLFDPEHLYTGVRFALTQGDPQGGIDFFGFDDFVAGRVKDDDDNGGGTVPEPGTLVLASVAALAAFGAARRRRRAG
jgi:hypothetical protein